MIPESPGTVPGGGGGGLKYSGVLTSKANTSVHGDRAPRNVVSATKHSPACRSGYVQQRLCAVDVIGGLSSRWQFYSTSDKQPSPNCTQRGQAADPHPTGEAGMMSRDARNPNAVTNRPQPPGDSTFP